MPFNIIRNDITKVSADAIVNTANPRPVCGGGTDRALYHAAGLDALLAERQKIGDIERGDAAATPAFALDAKYIIHTVGPKWRGGDYGERTIVRSCYEKSLKLAEKLGCKSIAFPLIATGVYGFPKDDALRIAISVFEDFLEHSEMEITMVVFDEEAFVLSGELFEGVSAYINQNYVESKSLQEYMGRRSDKSRRSGYFRPNINKTARESGFTEDKVLGSGSFDNLTDEMIRDDELFHALLSDDAADHSDGIIKEPSSDYSAAEKKKPRSLDELMGQVEETWQQSLLRLIDEKGYTDAEVYKRANIDRKLFSKIRNNAEYQPKKITAVALALALQLNLDETKDLLARAGYALSPSSRFDLIVEYFIEREVYDQYTINLALFEHEQPLIGA